MAKKQRSTAALWIVIAVLAFVAYIVLMVVLPSLLQPTTRLRLGDGVFQARLAMDADSRSRGLSGVSGLNVDQALIMAFPTDSKWSVWMKDMKIPLDIVWLDKDKKVVYRAKNIPAASGEVLTPPQNARYVVELPVGSIDNSAITANNIAEFDIKLGDIK